MDSRVGKIEVDPTLASLLSQAYLGYKKGVDRLADVGMMWLHGLQSLPGVYS